MRTTALTFALLASLSAAEAHPNGWDANHRAAHLRGGTDPTRLRDLGEATTQGTATETESAPRM